MYTSIVTCIMLFIIQGTITSTTQLLIQGQQLLNALFWHHSLVWEAFSLNLTMKSNYRHLVLWR